MSNIDQLSRFERDMLLDFMLYTMPEVQRGKLKTAHPVIMSRLYQCRCPLCNLSKFDNHKEDKA